jgi:hypothetical protein
LFEATHTSAHIPHSRRSSGHRPARCRYGASPDISPSLWQKAAVHGITEFPDSSLRPGDERLLL